MTRPTATAWLTGVLTAAALAVVVCPRPGAAGRAEARPDGTAETDAANRAAEAEALKQATALAEKMRSADVEVRKAAVKEAKADQHSLITTALGKALTDADLDVRMAALEALGARTEPAGKKSAAIALGNRLRTIADRPTLTTEKMKALTSLHDLAQPAALPMLVDRLGLEIEPEELSARLKAIANIPTGDAIEEIIQFRSSGRGLGDRTEMGYRRRYAREAFQYATGADVGNDPDAMRKWWKEHEKDFDFKDAAERRAKTGGGPKTNAKDGTSRDKIAR